MKGPMIHVDTYYRDKILLKRIQRPILFSAPMVRALLDGKKMQTRRAVKPQWQLLPLDNDDYRREAIKKCPYGQPDDRLWVRETFRPVFAQDPAYNAGEPIEYDYRATHTVGDRLGEHAGIKMPWKPSIFMPRSASRITLEITGVRVERLQAISDADAIAEGLDHVNDGAAAFGVHGLATSWNNDPRIAYRALWESINGTGSWNADPWVWVLSFQRLAFR